MSFMTIKTWLAGLCVLALVGCGGGGGSDAGGTPVLGGDTTTGATVVVSLSSAVLTAASPATVTVTLRDNKGNPVAGKVVDLKTPRGGLATLSVASVVTDAAGTGTATLSAAAGGLSGADEVVAVANLGTTTVQGGVSFSVTGSVPTIGLTISSTTLRASTGAVTLRAVLKDAAGKLLSNQSVGFSTAAGLVTLSAPSAVTDGFGTASVSVIAASGSAAGADVLMATATVAGAAIQSSLSVQVIADTLSVSISASSSNVSATAPATLSILVKDASGANAPVGTVVKVASSFGLTAFDATTASTDINGVAKVIVTPKTNTSNGADQIVATVTVGSVDITAKTVVQVTSASSSSAPPVLQSSLSSTSISSASPATVTATLTDGKGAPVAGQVVTFTVVRGLAKTNVGTALTDASGNAVVILSPASSTVAGADEVTASASLSGTTLQSTKGFQVQATNVTLSSFIAVPASLGAYGQATLTVGIVGASVGSPVNVSVTSSCVSQNKATLSPSTFTATSATVDLQFKDNGCGAIQSGDRLQAVIVGTASSVTLSLPISTPDAGSIAFVSAKPEIIYIKASGFTETSTLTFEVRDGAGNVLPNRVVQLSLLTRAGGVTMEGGIADVLQTSDATGRVTVRVNSGTAPTPIRVSAALQLSPTIATVSSNLSVAIGLPSQLNFSLSQNSKNIEGMNLDGIANSYMIIASDRSGNPVPAGTSINFVTESGQIEAIVQTDVLPAIPSQGSGSGLGKAVANFKSSSPRPADGRFTVTVYALGEESFIDQNGNNIYDFGEPFQDLGNIFKDRIFDGLYDASVDEYIPTNIANTSACLTPAASGPAFNGSFGVTPVTSALLALDPSIPSVGSVLSGAGTTCDGVWSGAGKVYVRRAAETVLSTSAARVLWSNTSGLDATCKKLTLQIGPSPTATDDKNWLVQGGETWYGNGSASLTLPFTVADSNLFPQFGALTLAQLTDPSRPDFSLPKGRLNPMAAGTTISASTPTTGLKVVLGGGSPVPSTTEATLGAVGVTFDTVSAGVVFVTFTSPSGLGTTYAINVRQDSTTAPAKPNNCPP